VAYALVCPRKLWLFSKGLGTERESERVLLGRVLEEAFFVNEKRLTDESVSLDFLRLGDEVVVHEVKLSSALEEAHEAQVKYYLYYLRSKGINARKGVLHYPKQRKVKEVVFNDEDEVFIEKLLRRVEEVLALDGPPAVERRPYCGRCAYYELCFA